MPTLIEQLKEQANGFNTLNYPSKKDFKSEFYKIENELKIKGKNNWKEIINGKIQQLKDVISENDEKYSDINEEETEFEKKMFEKAKGLVEKRDKAEEEYNNSLPTDEDGEIDENMTPEEQKLVSKTKKKYEDAKKSYEKWRDKNVTKPKNKLNDKKVALSDKNNELNDKIEQYSRYIKERDERERYKVTRPENYNAIKNSYKELKKAYESHHWFFKILANILPASLTKAGTDLKNLNEGKKTLLNTGYTEDEIKSYDKEVLDTTAEQNAETQVQNTQTGKENTNEGELLETQTNQVQNSVENKINKENSFVKKEDKVPVNEESKTINNLSK